MQPFEAKPPQGYIGVIRDNGIHIRDCHCMGHLEAYTATFFGGICKMPMVLTQNCPLTAKQVF